MRTIGILFLLIVTTGIAMKVIRDGARKQRNRAAIQRIIDAGRKKVRTAPPRVRPQRPLTAAEARWKAARSR